MTCRSALLHPNPCSKACVRIEANRGTPESAPTIFSPGVCKESAVAISGSGSWPKYTNLVRWALMVSLMARRTYSNDRNNRGKTSRTVMAAARSSAKQLSASEDAKAELAKRRTSGSYRSAQSEPLDGHPCSIPLRTGTRRFASSPPTENGTKLP